MHDYNLIFKDFIEGIQDESKKNKLITIFEFIVTKFPKLTPRFAWNQPMFTDHGTFIIAFSVAKNHISVAPEAKAIQKFKEQIEKSQYECSSMIFRIKFTQEIDFLLLEKIIEFNIIDKAEHSKFWR
jgi:uncharacterized protein YdhG (YjbR/CyaY superfamily)